MVALGRRTRTCAVIGAWSGVRPEGGFGGGQFGYNIQGILGPNVVLGVETDIQGGYITDSRTRSLYWHPRPILTGSERCVAALATPFDRALVYVTGGFAYGGIKNEENYRSAGNPSGWDYRFDGTATGYVIGGGVEYKFTPRWSVKAEYQYIDFGKNDPTSTRVFLGETVVSYNQSRWSLQTNSLTEDAFHTVRARCERTRSGKITRH